MIKKLKLNTFKCFQEIDMKFTNVNVLTGLNGMGKSTVMQGILLLAQDGKGVSTSQNLSLKGKYVNLGIGQDVLYEKAENDEIGIEILVEDNQDKIVLGYKSEEDVLPIVQKSNGKASAELEKCLSYLSAYRIEPRFLYQIENETELEKRYFGKNGEYAIQYLKLYGGDSVRNCSILRGNVEKDTILDQVKEWLDMISPGVSPIITVNPSSRTAELQYEYIENREKTNSYKSVNVGFGITYVLPVVVSLVAAQRGDVLLIENPEAHIHPHGQRMLGELIAMAGNGGVQVIVETHSDHVLNGIRVAVKQKKLKAADTSFFFFYKDVEDSFRHKVMCPMLDSNGRLDKWPEGFFDEWENALLELL